MQNELVTKKEMAAIGEEIGLELGSKMVRDYQVANPADTHWYIIGRNIIDQILAQPGCVGIKFYNAYNELGEKTLVYTGLDTNGNSILEITCIDNQGTLSANKGIVADRAGTNPTRTGRGTTEDEGWWWID